MHFNVCDLRIKPIRNTEVLFVGYLYVMELINAQKTGHIIIINCHINNLLNYPKNSMDTKLIFLPLPQF
jgi:hypothetical protein